MSETRGITVEAIEVRGAPALDPIHVYWNDIEPGKGHVTITCYGCAWTCYFGAMSDRTIREFFAGADTGYLVTKLGITPHLKQGKRDHAYLKRIIEAVKGALVDGERKA